MPFPGKMFQTTYILLMNKTVNSENTKLMTIHLDYESIAKCAQNVNREP